MLKKHRIRVDDGVARVVDTTTGLIIGEANSDSHGSLVYVPQKPTFGKDFAVVFQDVLLRLAMDGLQGNDLRVFLVILGTCGYENRCDLTQREIGDLLGMRFQHVSKSIRKLAEKGWLTKSDNVYYLLLDVAWRGKIQNYLRALNARRAV